MFDKEMSDGEEEVVKATNNILNHLKSVEISWTADQRRCWKEKIEESVKKNTRKGKYKDLLLNQCKRHGGPFTSRSEIRDLVKKTHDQKILKSYLRSEVGFQKALHPFDAKERSHLYKMNFLSVEELIENLTILLDITQSDEIGEDIHFPTEEMYELLTKDNQYVSVLMEADRSC